MSDPKGYYKIIKMTSTATRDEIRKAYLKLASQYHPDKFVDKIDKENAHKIFIKIGEAYEVLSDEKKRKQYDKYGHTNNYITHGYGMQNDFSYHHNNIFKYFDKMFEKHMEMFDHRVGEINIMHKNFLKHSNDDHDTFREYSKFQETVIVNGKPKTIIKEMTNKNGIVTEKVTKIDEKGHKIENKKITDHSHKSDNIKRIENKKH
jgi:DnaJ-class molecular chaperone